MSGGWLLRSTLGRREKFKERISPQGRKGVDTQETEEEEVEDGDGSATQLCSLFGVALLMCPALHLISDLHAMVHPIVISNTSFGDINAIHILRLRLPTLLTGIEGRNRQLPRHHTDRCNDVVEIRLRTASVNGRRLEDTCV